MRAQSGIATSLARRKLSKTSKKSTIAVGHSQGRDRTMGKSIPVHRMVGENCRHPTEPILFLWFLLTMACLVPLARVSPEPHTTHQRQGQWGALDEGTASPRGPLNPQRIPRPHDIHLDMSGALPTMSKGGGHRPTGVAVGGAAGVGDAAVVRVGNVGQRISTPRGTGDARSPSASLVDGFLVGSEVGRSFRQRHRAAHQGHGTAHSVSVCLTRLYRSHDFSKASIPRSEASKAC